ncbi:glycerophosphodiester phosphodiesterase [bacterium]|nr:MAG: glycerophosphodiester phosphodiesterase [bacterium]
MRPLVGTLLLVSLILLSCQKETEVVGPDSASSLFLANTRPLEPVTRASMEGVYRIVQGEEFFSDLVVLKWSGAASGADTAFYLSGFFGRDAAHFVLSAGSLDSALFFSGTWRKLMTGESGLLRAVVPSGSGGRHLMNPLPAIGRDSITIQGTWGNGGEDPSRSIVFRYDRPLHRGKNLEIIAHRGGGRTADRLPVSENSVDMILYAERLGATAVEIDVNTTKDGVPVLYHDATLNLRLVQKNGLVGGVEDYTYEQLQSLVRLIHGERIPTFREALDAALYRTKLQLVYIDVKPAMPVATIHQIQQEYMAKAAAAGRQFELLIGLPSEEKVNEFRALPNYTQIPSLCELTIDDVRALNSRVWSPRWTMGTQSDLVAQMHAEGRRAFVWTLDEPQYIRQFLTDGQFDGILTNYSCMVAYYHYVR